MKKCPKTVSGKHQWKSHFFAGMELGFLPLEFPKCEHCGLINDTKKLSIKKKSK